MIPAKSLHDKLQNTEQHPLIYGHRGARGEMPENTMPGFEHLTMHGITAVEIDVQNTVDAVPVLHHDPQISMNIARDAGGKWLTSSGPKIIESSHEELAMFDLGALKPGTEYQKKFSEQSVHKNVRMPTLEEFCIWLKAHPEMVVNIEIKSYADRQDLGDSPATLAKSVTNIVIEHGLVDRVIISSFDWRVLSAIRSIDERIARGFLTYLDRENPPMQPNIFYQSPWMDGAKWNGNEDALPELITELGGHVWAPYFEDLSASQVVRAKELGLFVNVWTVNSPEDIARMAEFEVDGIITDYPLRAKTILSAAVSQAVNM